LHLLPIISVNDEAATDQGTFMKVTNKMQLYRLIYYYYYYELRTEQCGLWGVYTPHNPHCSVSTHPRHQPAATWVNTTRYYNYSQVLLMMGENIARNM